MRFDQSGIAWLYLYALALGAFLGLFFDLIRLPRMLLTPKANPKKESAKQSLRKRRVAGVFVFLEDFLFCIAGSVCVILLFYEKNHGKIRPAAFFLLLGGFALYWATAGRWVRAFLAHFVGWIQKAVRLVCRIAWKPARQMLLFAKKLCKRLCEALSKHFEKQARKKNTNRLFGIVEQTAAGLLPGGVVLKKKKEVKSKGGKTRGGGKRKKDHCPKQKSVA